MHDPDVPPIYLEKEEGVMRRSVSLVLALASVLSLSACTAISYHPALSLGPSPVRILMPS